MKPSKAWDVDAVRPDFVPKEVYTSKEFAKLEEERLWPYVWQVACRIEEIANVGDFVTYDIVNQSIIVVRTSKSQVKAFHNVCLHRGMPLTQGCGNTKRFHCRFHGWKYGLDGKNLEVVDQQDWKDCLKAGDADLREVQLGIWGGFVFINMDPNCESLESFLRPIDDYCAKFEFEKLSYRWYKTAVVPANWKAVLENFNEFYHVQQAHPQLLSFTNDVSTSNGMGRHGSVRFAAEGAVPFKRSDRLPKLDKEQPFREYVLEYVEQYNRDLKAMVTERVYKATQRLRTEVSDDATPVEVLTKWGQIQVEAAMEDGSGWPAELTPEYIERSGLDWHLFPNSVFLHGTVDGILFYRGRPNGDDPDSSIFDVWALDRYAKGKAPPLEREFYQDWRECEWPLIYKQDFVNMSVLQRGLKSQGLPGLRVNPVQERAIYNFHRALRRFIKDPHDHPDPEREA